MTRRSIALAVVGTAMMAVGCTNGEDTGAPSSPGVPGTAASPTAGVSDCVTGQWRSTALDSRVGGDVASAQIRGGAGISVTIEPTGTTRVVFTDMQPVTFTARVSGVNARGQFLYTGQATGRITTSPEARTASPTTGPAASGATASGPGTPEATSGTPGGPASAPRDGTTPTSPTGEESGTWQPVGDMDWSGVRVTLDLAEPVKARLFDNAPIGQYVGTGADQSGNVVDVDPLFDNGRYTCQGDRLTVTPDDDGDVPWTLVRV